MRGGREQPLRIHPRDAERYGLEDGGTRAARVQERRRSRCPCASPTRCWTGVVALPHGWGHRGGWQVANAAGGVNVNVLASADAERPRAARRHGVPQRDPGARGAGRSCARCGAARRPSRSRRVLGPVRARRRRSWPSSRRCGRGGRRRGAWSWSASSRSSPGRTTSGVVTPACRRRVSRGRSPARRRDAAGRRWRRSSAVDVGDVRRTGARSSASAAIGSARPWVGRTGVACGGAVTTGVAVTGSRSGAARARGAPGRAAVARRARTGRSAACVQRVLDVDGRARPRSPRRSTRRRRPSWRSPRPTPPPATPATPPPAAAAAAAGAARRRRAGRRACRSSPGPGQQQAEVARGRAQRLVEAAALAAVAQMALGAGARCARGGRACLRDPRGCRRTRCRAPARPPRARRARGRAATSRRAA